MGLFEDRRSEPAGPYGFTSQDRPRPPQVTTAAALAVFRDELIDRGFDPDDVRDLVRVALAGEVRSSGLAVAAPESKTPPAGGQQ